MVRLGVVGTVIGGFVALYSAWYIIRGPFFGYPIPPRWTLLVACGTFIIGALLAAGAAQIAVGSRTGDRPDIEDEHDHTMDWIQR